MKPLRMLAVGWKRPQSRTFSTLALDYYANVDDAAIRQRVSAEVERQRTMPADFELALQDFEARGGECYYVKSGIDWETIEQEEWGE